MIKFRHFRSRLASTKCCAMGFKNYSVWTINYKVLLWKIHRCWILGWLKKSQSSISNSSERFCFTKTLILSKLAFKAFIMKSASFEFRKAELLVFIYDRNETVYQNPTQFIFYSIKMHLWSRSFMREGMQSSSFRAMLSKHRQNNSD